MAFAEMPIQENVTGESDASIDTMPMALQDSSSPEAARKEVSGIVAYVKERFEDSKSKRLTDERRWLECYNNFRGVYGPDTRFTSTEKSQAFIKITKTKVQAGFAQIVDVLFAGNKFPIGIEPPKIPVDGPEKVSFDPPQPGQPGKKPEEESSRFAPGIANLLFGPKKKLLEKVKDDLKEGVAQTPQGVTFDPVKDAATKLEKKIHDQLEEANANKALRSVVYDQCLFGTGVLKGPFATDKEYPRWDEAGNYTPVIKTIPLVEHVSIWDAYPDADARNMDECEHFIQRHRLSRTQLTALKKRPMFLKKAIDLVIANGENYVPMYWEAQLQEDENATPNSRWEVLEFWGMIDQDTAKDAGLKVPKELKDFDQIQVNVWLCGDEVIRLVLNPFKPSFIPYRIAPYELHPYSIFGVGIAENMIDTQLLMNGFMRLAVDNAALSSNIIFEVNEDMLVPGQSMELYPGKVFRRMGGQPGQAINVNKIDNVTQEVLFLFDKARQLADEATGMPSYAHGMTGVMSTGKTASGMSMLMGAAAQNIKAVVRNIDDYLLAPLGKALFAFNMQFNFDKDYIGDVTVVAKGTESLMRNEVRSQKLLQFAQFAAGNQMMAPYVNWGYILREFAASIDIDEEDAVNDPRAAAIQAAEMAKFQQMLGPQDPAQNNAQAAANGQVPGAPPPQPDGGVPPPQDPTGNGGGNISPGAAPPPGAAGFSGNQGQAA